MKLRLCGVERQGPAVDLRDVDVDPATVLAAVRDPSDERVRCAAPGAVHERVGFLHRDCSIAPRAALADAARSRGESTQYDAELRAVEADLADIDASEVDLEGARERVAETAADVDALRERVARASGRVEAMRDGGSDPADAEADLETATQKLAAAETDHHAAREALARAREQAQAARDARERRLELEDRRENLRRAARQELADRYTEQFRRALASLPVPGDPAGPSGFGGPEWAVAAAVARVAAVRAPLVVSAAIFERPTRTRAALDAPVVLVEV
jgi:multidrug resistance efflux pump